MWHGDRDTSMYACVRGGKKIYRECTKGDEERGTKYALCKFPGSLKQRDLWILMNLSLISIREKEKKFSSFPRSVFIDVYLEIFRQMQGYLSWLLFISLCLFL